MPNALICNFFVLFCFNFGQRFTVSCVPEGRNLTCCLSSQSSHPLPSLDYHQVEAYRASKKHKSCVSVCVCSLYWKFTPCYFSVLQEELHYFCLLSTKRDTQAHSTKCEYILHICLILTIRRHAISVTVHNIFTIIFSIICVSRAWEGPEDPDLILSLRIHGGTVINVNIKTVFFMCALWQKGRWWTDSVVCLHHT